MAGWIKMIIKLALRNIIGYGYRSLINMFILAIVLTGMIWMQAMYLGWFGLAEEQMRAWETAAGQFHNSAYDPYDAFGIDAANATVPEEIQREIDAQRAVPILLSTAVIYPEGRMMPTLAKGIPASQQLLQMPTQKLKPSENDIIPVLIGSSMARSTRLNQGDIFTMRIKDASGVYNAIEMQVVEIMKSPLPSIDNGQIWMDLEYLQELKQLPKRASIITMADENLKDFLHADWNFKDMDILMADLRKIKETETGQQNITFALLLFLGMIAVFDAQFLALFKRRKEIGTLSAMGMTKAKIILLFTTEGILYYAFAVLITATLGFPLFWYYAVYGYKMPKGFEAFEMTGISDAIPFRYSPQMIVSTVLIVLVLTAIVSWIPAARIARLKPTDALRGKL